MGAKITNLMFAYFMKQEYSREKRRDCELHLMASTAAAWVQNMRSPPSRLGATSPAQLGRARPGSARPDAVLLSGAKSLGDVLAQLDAECS